MTPPATDTGVRRTETLAANDPPPRTWADGPKLSDLERRQYEFEGGGAASERQPRRRPGWFARLFVVA